MNHHLWMPWRISPLFPGTSLGTVPGQLRSPVEEAGFVERTEDCVDYAPRLSQTLSTQSRPRLEGLAGSYPLIPALYYDAYCFFLSNLVP